MPLTVPVELATGVPQAAVRAPPVPRARTVLLLARRHLLPVSHVRLDPGTVWLGHRIAMVVLRERTASFWARLRVSRAPRARTAAAVARHIASRVRLGFGTVWLGRLAACTARRRRRQRLGRRRVVLWWAT